MFQVDDLARIRATASVFSSFIHRQVVYLAAVRMSSLPSPSKLVVPPLQRRSCLTVGTSAPSRRPNSTTPAPRQGPFSISGCSHCSRRSRRRPAAQPERRRCLVAAARPVFVDRDLDEEINEGRRESWGGHDIIVGLATQGIVQAYVIRRASNQLYREGNPYTRKGNPNHEDATSGSCHTGSYRLR
jgi:hypothetical protein